LLSLSKASILGSIKVMNVPSPPPNPALISRLRLHFIDYLRRKRKRRAGRRWVRDGGNARFRYSYDLGPESVVFDCGAYVGDFASEMIDRYQCKVFCFEPLQGYFEKLSRRFAGQPLVTCLNYGIGSRSMEAKISVEQDASSLFRAAESGRFETVRFMDINEALQLAGGGRIDLLKLNIEGGEFEILEAILERNLATRFRHIQVQFHQVVPDFHERRLGIREKLAATHRLGYDYYFVFESWSLLRK
jgi:FkbM family methyltransferase